MKREIMQCRNHQKWMCIISFIVVIALSSYTVYSQENKQSAKNEGKELTLISLKSELTDPVIPIQNTHVMEKEETTKPEGGARIQPKPMSEMHDEWIKILERLPGAGLKGLYTPVNVFGTLMYNPETMASFLDYWVTSKLKMGFTGREQELIILRMGFLFNSNYVWKHHIPPAREFGVNDAEIAAVKSKPLPDIFSAREKALLMLTDEMVEYRTIRDLAWSKWSGELKSSELLDLVSIVSQYVFFALLNNSFQVEIEEPLKSIPGLY